MAFAVVRGANGRIWLTPLCPEEATEALDVAEAELSREAVCLVERSLLTGEDVSGRLAQVARELEAVRVAEEEERLAEFAVNPVVVQVV